MANGRSAALGSWAVFLALLAGYLWRAPSYHYFLTNADHASNVGLGSLIARGGHFPFVDHFHFYGPLAALVSALGMWIHDSLLSEVAICSLGWAAAIALVHHAVARHAGRGTALTLALVAFALTPRFYKYYYWLMPALGLFVFDAIYRGGPKARPGWGFAAGLVAGSAGLFRWDLGVLLACFLTTATAALTLWGAARLPLRALGVAFGAGAAVPLGAWCAALATRGGPGAIRDYLAASYDGTRGYLGRHPDELFWSFRWDQPFSAVSATVICYWLYPLVCAAALAYGARALRESDEGERGRDVFLAAAALLALGASPQFYQTARPTHLLQVALPFFAAAALLARRLIAPGAGRQRTRLMLARRGAAVLLLGALGAVAWGVRGYGSADLSPLRHDAVLKYRKLAGGLRSELNDEFWADVMRKIRRLTAPGDPILVFDNAAQYYYFAERRMSGIFHNYAGVYAGSPEWLRRNIEALERDPPKLVVVREQGDFLTDPPSRNPVRGFYPEVYAFIVARYRDVAFRKNTQLILFRSTR